MLDKMTSPTIYQGTYKSKFFKVFFLIFIVAAEACA